MPEKYGRPPAKYPPDTAKVYSSFKSLSVTANALNSATKQLSATATTVDDAIKRLNLGISSWVTFGGGESDDGDTAESYELGYAKINGKWGLAIRHCSWPTSDPDHGDVNEWLFADASRELRIAAIGSLPELIDTLNNDAAAITAKLNRKIEEAELLAKVLNSIDTDPSGEAQ